MEAQTYIYVVRKHDVVIFSNIQILTYILLPPINLST